MFVFSMSPSIPACLCMFLCVNVQVCVTSRRGSPPFWHLVLSTPVFCPMTVHRTYDKVSSNLSSAAQELPPDLLSSQDCCLTVLLALQRSLTALIVDCRDEGLLCSDHQCLLPVSQSIFTQLPTINSILNLLNRFDIFKSLYQSLFCQEKPETTLHLCQ